MPKFNTSATRAAARSPITSEAQPTTTTYEGGPGWVRDARSELFLLAVANMVGEDTFYERAADRDDRYSALVQRLACEDAEWTAGFLGWLRGPEVNMRSAALVGAAEYVRGRLAAAGSRPSGQHETEVPGTKAWEGDHLSYSVLSNRHVIDSVLQRADEPGELLAYWTSKYGRAIPKPIKRGVGDAVLRLGTEFNYLKWDSESRGFSFADILNLTHPGDRKGSAQGGRFQGPWQHDLFGYVVAKPYREVETPESLNMLTRRQALMALPVDERRQILEDPELLRRAGITWEALAGWLQGPMDADAWSAVIPSMGYMALLRNLRNFDQAGVPDEVAEQVAARLADPDRVAKSRQLPMRFLSAYRAAPSLRWGYALEKALAASLGNIPALAGRTLILVDTSSSMNAGFSKDGTLMRWDAAATFAVALAQRCANAEVVSFSSAQYYRNDPPGAKTKVFPLRGGESLLRSLERWKGDGYFLGGGTDTAGAVQKHFKGHDRVVIVTDEQSTTKVDAVLSQDVPLYTWNLAGYAAGHGPSGVGRWHTFGGLTDAAFRMVPLLEAGRNAAWPWEQA